VKRPLKPDEIKIWGMVAATVHPMPGRRIPKAEAPPSLSGEGQVAKRPGGATPDLAPTQHPGPTPPPASASPRHPPHKGEGKKGIEPNRRHRIAKAREEIGGRLDLHGLDQDRAKAVLEGFLVRAWNDGMRAVLVITGKGVQGDGILKRRTPEWLAAPHLSHIVAGISDAARHHGGAGALYVALKRKGRR
jgi:DNA-nicking Smr family endonuclease